MAANCILSFTENASIETEDGKGLNLMRMTKAGMPVPPGFVVPTAAYADFIRFNRIDKQLTVSSIALEYGKSLTEISAQIRAAFVQGEFPADWAKQIIKAYRELGKKADKSVLSVAIRRKLLLLTWLVLRAAGNFSHL